MNSTASTNSSSAFVAMGSWEPGTKHDPAGLPAFAGKHLVSNIQRVREPVHVVQKREWGSMGIAYGGVVESSSANSGSDYLWMGTLPPLYPEWLGDRSFQETHRVRFPYIAGEMANGIATAQMVIAMANANMLGFFGSAGLPLERVEQSIRQIQQAIGHDGKSWGANLIHSPNEPDMEERIVDLFIQYDVQRVSTSAFMSLTPSVVRYACNGLKLDAAGKIIRKNYVFAKISRPEVAKPFMSPPPDALLEQLVSQGKITRNEAEIAKRIPIAEDITVEADSGGHTDNRPLTSLFPSIKAIRDELAAAYSYPCTIRLGAAGGIGTPDAAAAAFALGAAYVLTGSINQSTVESGLSQEGKELLARAELADVIMAPAADMFELGVKVQVLKRGTMFSMRGFQLYEIYRTYASIQELPTSLKEKLEKEVFRAPLDQIWKETREFFLKRDPQQVERAQRDPKHQMALLFRWYLGQASRWAINGMSDRRIDYQIWCGPAMGAFNAWTAGSYLSHLANRNVVQIALNLLEGAAVITRAHQLRSYGVPIPAEAFQFTPRQLI